MPLLSVNALPVQAAESAPAATAQTPGEERDWQSLLMTLLEKYGLDCECRAAEQSLSRQEMAVLLQQLLQHLEGQTLPPADREHLNALQAELAVELAQLSSDSIGSSEAENQGLNIDMDWDERLSVLEDQSDLLAARHFDLREDFQAFQASLPFKVFGSVALRTCSMMETTQNQILGNIFQVRLGAGLRGQVNENWDYAVRLLSQDAQSYNLSWFPFGGDSTPRTPVTLDRYFIRWTPLQGSKTLPRLRVTVGKALNFLPETQLFFDEDVSFTGLQEELNWQNPFPEIGWQNLNLHFGQHALLTQDTFITTSLLAGKASSDWRWGDWGLRTALSYSHYAQADALTPLALNLGYMGAFSQRNRIQNNAFVSDFDLLNGSAALTWHWHEQWPLRLTLDAIHNFGAADRNQAYWLGLSLGQLRQAGDWRFDYVYRSMQQDSNLALMVDDFFAGTDVAGHTFTAGAQVSDSTFAFVDLIARQSLSQDTGTLWILYLTLRQDF